jgi:hypothetical protein
MAAAVTLGPLRRTLLAIVMVLGAGALAPPGFGAEDVARPDRFRELRVCGATTFSRSLGRCTRDERRTAIASNRISCSVTLLAQQSGVWRARFHYAGAVEPWGRGGKVAKGANSLVLSTNIRTNQPLPGGKWTCEFAFRSARAAAAFRSGGPEGKIVDTAVCPESAVLSYGRQKVCASDHSGRLLPLSEPVYCSAVFARAGGRSAQIQFLQKDGSAVWVWNFDIPWPTVYQNYAFTTAIRTEGDYVCRFTLDDGYAVDKPFRIGRARVP